MNTEILTRALAGSMAGTNTFPDVVRILMAEGVESYRADLVRLEETFYMPDGNTHVEKMEFPRRPIGENFSAADVVAALRAIQAGACTYAEFLRRIMDAGTTHYEVFLKGRKVIYYGRAGEFHIEEFPRADRSATAEHRVGGLKTIVVKEGNETDFEKMFGELRAAMAAREPDCLLYSLMKSDANPRACIVQEQYRDRAALDAHQQSEHGKIWFPKIRAILESIQVEYFDVVIP